MKRISVINQKGGSGKTTTTVNAAAALAHLGQRVLVIDMDPQSSASGWFGVRDDGHDLLDVLTGEQMLADIIRPSVVDGVDVVPSSLHLWSADKILASEPGAESILRRSVDALPATWDIVLIDGPPSLGLLAWSAMIAAPHLLVPCEASVLAATGMVGLIRAVDAIADRVNPDVCIGGVLACRVDKRTKHSGDVVSLLRERFSDLVYQTVIRENTKLKECPNHEQPINLYAPGSPGAKDYASFAVELLGKLSHQERDNAAA